MHLRRSARWGGWAIVLALGLVAACGGKPGQQAAPLGPGTVTLSIFSGRPDPTWPIPATDIDKLRGMIAGMEAGGPLPQAPGLGYRGFAVAWSGSEPGSSVQIEAFEGIVVAREAGETRSYADPGRRVERFLLDLAGSRLDPSLYQTILNGLN